MCSFHLNTTLQVICEALSHKQMHKEIIKNEKGEKADSVINGRLKEGSVDARRDILSTKFFSRRVVYETEKKEIALGNRGNYLSLPYGVFLIYLNTEKGKDK